MLKTNKGLAEYWKDIAGYENKYQVSNLGNVRSLNYHREHKVKLLAFIPDSDGYQQVKLCKDGKVTLKRVHRLVAETFIEKVLNKDQVNHIDGNKKNNCINNLEWVTSKENMEHAFKTGLMANVYKPRNQLGKKVFQYDQQNKLIKIWNSTREIEKTLKLAHSSISYACKNGSIFKNYLWSYKEVV